MKRPSAPGSYKAEGAKNLRVPTTYICSYNVRSLKDHNRLEELENELSETRFKCVTEWRHFVLSSVRWIWWSKFVIIGYPRCNYLQHLVQIPVHSIYTYQAYNNIRHKTEKKTAVATWYCKDIEQITSLVYCQPTSERLDFITYSYKQINNLNDMTKGTVSTKSVQQLVTLHALTYTFGTCKKPSLQECCQTMSTN